MLDAGVKIIDRMIDLLREKERNKRKLFTDFVHPIFEDMGTIHKDYIQSFTALIQEIHDLDSEDQVHTVLLRRKSELEHLRVKVHSFLKEAKKYEGFPGPVNDFFNACVRYFTTQSGQFATRYQLHYTDLLALLSGEKSTYSLPNNAGPENDLPVPKYSIERLLHALLGYIKRQWAEITNQYAVCKFTLLK